MRTSRLTAGLTALVALALITAGCSSETPATHRSRRPAPAARLREASGGGGTLRISNAITTDPIIPMTVDTATTRVMDMVWTGLVRYDDKLAPYNANAESIETTDATTFTITLKQDYTFSDGTPVNADSYVDAWNYSAYGPNAAQSSSYFSLIKGYDALNPAPAEGSDDRAARRPPRPCPG